MPENNVTDKYSRREFFWKIPGALGALGFLKLSDSNIKSPDLLKLPQKNIIYRTLGRTGIQAPIVSMGVMNTTDPKIIKQSYNAGVRLFDTAAAYRNGENEKMIGRVFKEYSLRKEAILQTKILHPVGVGYGRSSDSMRPDQVRKTFIKKFEESLNRLQTDYADILFYHSVDDVYKLNDPGVREALIQIKNDGKARFLGISTHKKRIIDEVAASGFFDVIMVQINFTMDDDTKYIESIKNAASKGMGIIAMKTQGGNRLARSIMDHKAALKWVLRYEFISTAVPGYTGSDQLKENFSVAYDLRYTEEERMFLENKKVKMGTNFCRQCGQCIVNCPNRADIPALMRVHMYMTGYKNFQLAEDTLNEIPESEGLQNCSYCKKCTVRCRYIVDITKNIEELKSIYM